MSGNTGQASTAPEAPRNDNEITDFVKEINEALPDLHTAISELTSELGPILIAEEGAVPSSLRTASSSIGQGLAMALASVYSAKRAVNDIRERSQL